jgi:plastocyanin
VAANIPGVPPVLNAPGQPSPGTAQAAVNPNAGAQIGPSGVASATGSPANSLPPAPTAGGATTDIVRIVETTPESWAFDPTPVRIPVNQPITWINASSGIIHIVAEDNTSFDSGVLAPGESFSYTPTLIGSYYYRDKLRPWLRGVVVAHGGR